MHDSKLVMQKAIKQIATCILCVRDRNEFPTYIIGNIRWLRSPYKIDAPTMYYIKSF